MRMSDTKIALLEATFKGDAQFLKDVLHSDPIPKLRDAGLSLENLVARAASS